MDFDFTPEQIAMRKHMREFAEREIAPKAQAERPRCKFDWDIAKKIFAEGFLGCPVPEKYGGLGMDYVAYGLMTEEVNRVCSSTRTLFSCRHHWLLSQFSNGAPKSRRSYSCLNSATETSRLLWFDRARSWL
jgi:alkylation response protein AidB-like acyl-CoA dehydrogenase